MSHQCLADAFRPADVHYKEKMLHYIWGHLAPKRNKAYPGFILFTHSDYGDLTIIKSKFRSLPDSPWFYKAMEDFVYENAQKTGCIYHFKGVFKNYSFVGKVTEILTHLDGEWREGWIPRKNM